MSLLLRQLIARNHRSAAPAGAPQLVHTYSESHFSATVFANWSFTPTADNLLVVTVFMSGTGTPSATPTGWTAVDGSGQNTSRPMQIFTRVSDGTETGFSATYSSSSAYGVMVAEWQDATTVAPFNGTSIASGTSTPTLGPTLAPPVAGALPLFFSTSRTGGREIASVPPGWTLPLADTVSYVPILTYMPSAPGTAVSETVTLDATTSTFYQWASTWIY